MSNPIKGIFNVKRSKILYSTITMLWFFYIKFNEYGICFGIGIPCDIESRMILRKVEFTIVYYPFRLEFWSAK